MRSVRPRTRDSHGKGAVTRIATFGDMGHSHYNNMQSLKDDAAAGLIDVVVHMGDHAYDLGNANDRRGDAYMNAWQLALSSLPWFPIIYDLNGCTNLTLATRTMAHGAMAMAWGMAMTAGTTRCLLGAKLTAWAPNPRSLSRPQDYPRQAKKKPQQQNQQLHSTATSALGQHLAAGSLMGMGSHGASPSNTSRYTSDDIGLIHMVALDLNLLDAGQLAWLSADLEQANANRNARPLDHGDVALPDFQFAGA